MRIVSLFILLIYTSVVVCAQVPQNPKVWVKPTSLYAKINNPIRILAQQNEAITIDDISASFQLNYGSEHVPIKIVDGKSYFIIRPDTIGYIHLTINLQDDVETHRFSVEALEAEGRLGRHKGNNHKKVGLGEFKAQLGITAIITCCDINAMCKMLGYEMIRVSKDNKVQRCQNKGGKFQPKTQSIIANAQSGDLFIFRNIKYRCPGAPKIQFLDDMTFEIK